MIASAQVDELYGLYYLVVNQELDVNQGEGIILIDDKMFLDSISVGV